MQSASSDPVERACPRRFSPVKDTLGEDYARSELQHIVITTNGADASGALLKQIGPSA